MEYIVSSGWSGASDAFTHCNRETTAVVVSCKVSESRSGHARRAASHLYAEVASQHLPLLQVLAHRHHLGRHAGRAAALVLAHVQRLLRQAAAAVKVVRDLRGTSIESWLSKAAF